MKLFFRQTVTTLLTILASIKLSRSGAKVIGITGSVGKTSTKDAIALVLSSKYKVHYDKKGYNTEIGLPLGILGLTSPMSSSVQDWLRILFKGFFNVFKNERYDFLIAEMGVDAPGDMDILLRLLKPHIAVLTSIAPVHLAHGQFTSVEHILSEKKKIFSKQTASDIAIINTDDALVQSIEKELNSTIYTFGSAPATLELTDITTNIQGTSFTARWKDQEEQFFIPVLGEYHAQLMAPAIIIALNQGYTMPEVRDILALYTAPKGRMRILEGKNGSIIIDGSYNASSLAMKAGIDTIAGLSGAHKKILCLGNMNELGEHSIAIHKEVGAYCAGKADILVAVAKDTQHLAEAAIEAGFPSEKVHYFDDSRAAGKFVVSLLEKDDVVFAKGSQNGVRMERLVEEVMNTPETASKELVRQSKYWTNI